MHALFATEKGQIVEVVRDLERDASTALRLPASKHQRKAPLKPPHKPAPPRVTADGGRERLLRDLDAFGEAEAASRFAPSSTEDAAGRETHDLLRAVLRDARTAPAAAQAVLGSPADISPGSAHFIDCAGLLGGAVARRLAEVSVTQADSSGGGGGSGSATASRRWSVISHIRPVSAALGAAAVLDDSTLRRATVAARNTATAGRVQKHALRIAALDAELAATEAAYAAVAAEADAALGGTLSAGTAAVAGAHERHGGARAAQGERLRTVRAELVALEAAHSRAEDVARRQVAAAGADRDAAAAACDALAAARAEGEGDRDALAAIAAQVTAFERYFARVRRRSVVVVVRVAGCCHAVAPPHPTPRPQIDAEAGRVEEEAAAEAARRSHKTRISALVGRRRGREWLPTSAPPSPPITDQQEGDLGHLALVAAPAAPHRPFRGVGGGGAAREEEGARRL